MTDMLIRLNSLAGPEAAHRRIEHAGVSVRRAIRASDLSPLRSFASAHFGESWADGVTVALANQPASAFVALHGGEIVGFALFDVAHRAWFGPVGVREEMRRMGVGTALLLCCLDAMAATGYAYAFVGDAWPPEFYERACGATVIA